jgi:hypothetical protein
MVTTTGPIHIITVMIVVENSLDKHNLSCKKETKQRKVFTWFLFNLIRFLFFFARIGPDIIHIKGNKVF